MTENNSTSRQLAFGAFTLDLNLKELRRAGTSVPLRPQTFDFLEYLARNPGRVVTKDELLVAVWKGAHVTTDSLVQCVHELRAALGDSELIRTLPRRGYTLAANVVPDPAGTLPVQSTRQRARRPVLMLVLAAALAALGIRVAQSDPSRTLAVLPFVPLDSRLEQDEILGLGMADALIVRLSGVARLVVRPTSAVLRFRAAEVSAEEAGRKLGADYVLEGRTQRLGNRVRVTAQLVAVDDGSTRWKDVLEIEETDLFRMQDAIAERTATSLLRRLTERDRGLLVRHDTAVAEARAAYEKGRYHWARQTDPALRSSIEEFERAIALDPRYALAYAGAADAYNLLGVYGTAEPRASFQRAKSVALKALALDPELSEAHAALAFATVQFDHDWAAAEAGYRKAIELSTGNVNAMQWLAQACTALGRFDEAARWARRAVASDPASPATAVELGRVYYFSRHYDDAIATLKPAVELEPSFVPAHIELGRAYRQNGLNAQAIEEFRRAAALSEDSAAPLAELAAAKAQAGDLPGAQGIFRRLVDRDHCNDVSRYHFALVRAALRDVEAAIDDLEEAAHERSSAVAFANVEPQFDTLRGSPRFRALVAELGLASSAGVAKTSATAAASEETIRTVKP